MNSRKKTGARKAPVKSASKSVAKISTNDAVEVSSPASAEADAKFEEPVPLNETESAPELHDAATPSQVAATNEPVLAAPEFAMNSEAHVEPAPVEEPAPAAETFPEIAAQTWQAEEPASEPATTEPAPAEPAFSEPVLSEPVLSESVLAEPLLVEPVSAEPVLDEAPMAQSILETPLISEVTPKMTSTISSFSDAQESARSLAAASLNETKARFAEFKSFASDTASAIENSYATAKTGAQELNAKSLEAFKSAAEANFEFLKSVFGVKSPSEYVSLHSEFARKQIDAAQSNAKTFADLAQKVATDSVEPLKTQFAKAFHLHA